MTAAGTDSDRTPLNLIPSDLVIANQVPAIEKSPNQLILIPPGKLRPYYIHVYPRILVSIHSDLRSPVQVANVPIFRMRSDLSSGTYSVLIVIL